LTHPLARYALAVRPGFLVATAVACLLGMASAAASGADFQPGLAAVTMVGALLIHAGINVLNDYYDAAAGTDWHDSDRIFPFTGGSRFIQNGVLSAEQTYRYGWTLLAAGAAAGLLLVGGRGPGLLVIGLVGLVIGWAYSAPALRLSGRGLGELAVAVGFGVLIPLGADWVQRGSLAWPPVMAGGPFGLLTANLLFLNQFPDYRADVASGKRHWVVRLGPQRARWGYALLALAAYAWLVAGVASGALPLAALAGLLAAVPSLRAVRQVLAYYCQPSRLETSIRASILALTAYGVLVASGLWFGGWG
jgi:1,4-dihydroxy-2-naphthoate octaprenyltransferase